MNNSTTTPQRKTPLELKFFGYTVSAVIVGLAGWGFYTQYALMGLVFTALILASAFAMGRIFSEWMVNLKHNGWAAAAGLIVLGIIGCGEFIGVELGMNTIVHEQSKLSDEQIKDRARLEEIKAQQTLNRATLSDFNASEDAKTKASKAAPQLVSEAKSLSLKIADETKPSLSEIGIRILAFGLSIINLVFKWSFIHRSLSTQKSRDLSREADAKRDEAKSAEIANDYFNLLDRRANDPNEDKLVPPEVTAARRLEMEKSDAWARHREEQGKGVGRTA